MEYIIGSVLILFSLIIIFVVLLQEGRQANVGVISGAADSFMDKGKAKSLDQKLSKWTKVLAIAFFVLVLAGMLVTNYFAEQTKQNASQPSEDSSSSSVNVSNGTTTNDVELDWSDDKEESKDDSKEESKDDSKEETKKDDASNQD